MRGFIQITLLFIIQLILLVNSYCSQNQNDNYRLHIHIKNLNEERIYSADITVVQLKSDKKQKVRYSEENRCFVAENLELGKVLIKVKSKGYDTMEWFHSLRGSNESVSIILGKTNSRYRIINSNKYSIETDGRTVVLFARKDSTVIDFFKKTEKSVIILKSGWYKYMTATSSSGRLYLITPTENQHQNALLSDLRKLFPEKPIGILVSTTQGFQILRNSCHIEFYSDVQEIEKEKILKSFGAIKWNRIKGSSMYEVSFSLNTGLDILKVAEKLSLMKGIKSVSNQIYNTRLPSTDLNH